MLFDMWNSNGFRNWWIDVITAEGNGHIMNGFRSNVVNTCVTSKANARFVIELEININVSGKSD